MSTLFDLDDFAETRRPEPTPVPEFCPGCGLATNGVPEWAGGHCFDGSYEYYWGIGCSWQSTALHHCTYASRVLDGEIEIGTNCHAGAHQHLGYKHTYVKKGVPMECIAAYYQQERERVLASRGITADMIAEPQSSDARQMVGLPELPISDNEGA